MFISAMVGILTLISTCRPGFQGMIINSCVEPTWLRKENHLVVNPPIAPDPSSQEARDYGRGGVVSFFNQNGTWLNTGSFFGLGPSYICAAPGSGLSMGVDWVAIGAIQDFD